MSNLIIDSSESPIKPAFDPFLDKPLIRREAQVIFHKIGYNQTEMFTMIDTVNVVANFLCEKLGVTRGELEVYAEKKKAEAQAWAEAQNKTQEPKDDLGREEGI